MSENELQTLKEAVGAVLAQEQSLTAEMIRTWIARMRQPFPSVTDEQAEALAREFESIHAVSMDLGSTLEAPGFEPWLDAARAEIDPYYWSRYRRFLVRKQFSNQVLAAIDDVTNRTLGLLENPKKEGRWDRRGMVVGHVQSGKTANYTGLICKAADAGYRVIIIIAGIHNNLRSQTQLRINEGFIGFHGLGRQQSNRTDEGAIGVGRLDRSRRPNAFTNTLRDFNRQTATSVDIPLVNLNEPAVFVIKKNTHTLKSLIEWLKEHNAMRGTSSISEPMLLIDDEADNASINIGGGPDEVSRINGQIRQLLDIFDRSGYVGYTATPFANIFIDPRSEAEMFGEDLFPRDFIVSLDPPDNYFGATRVFLADPDNDRGTSIIRHIEDNADLLPLKHKKEHRVVGLPDSLQQAIRTFIVGRTIRLIRGHAGEHNSMLVNASRFTDVQGQLRNEIHSFVNTILENIRVNGSNPVDEALRDPEIAALKRVFDEEYKGSKDSEGTSISWPAVQNRLLESAGPISVIEVNSSRRSQGALDYSGHREHGLNVIAVGGFSLSRGLTLEGLMVSYFLRNSMMYDTLMQMGRWFGYRPGYEDLCRVWMPEEAEGWYAHIAESIEELRDELRRMEAVNATPREFGLKVRSHPDTLIVTARNKMGSGERLVVSIGLANQFVETAVLRWDEESRVANHRAAIGLAENLEQAGHTPENQGEPGRPSGLLSKQVPVSHVVDFLTAFRNHEGSFLTETDPIIQYIQDRIETELAEWDIFFPSVQVKAEESLVDSSLGFEVVCQRRAAGERSIPGTTLMITNKQRVSSRGIEVVGLSEAEVASAKEEYRQKKKQPRSEEGLNYPDHIYRNVRHRPLLVVHLLSIGKREEDLSGDKPMTAWSISFPRTDHEEKTVEYVVNTTWFRERYREEEDEDEIGGGDD